MVTLEPATRRDPGGFRAYLAGTLLARLGDWMDLVALNWAVLQLTGSPWHLALINACRLVPAFVLSVPAGLLADRMDRRTLLAGLQLGTVLGSLGLARRSSRWPPWSPCARPCWRWSRWRAAR